MSELLINQLLQIALKQYQACQFAHAETSCNQILIKQPEHAETLHLLGVIAGLNGQHDIAVDLFRRAITSKPNYADAYSNLGSALWEKRQYDEAIKVCRQAIDLQSNHASAHNNLGNALKDTGQIDKAIAAYGQAIVHKPDYLEAHSNLILYLHYHPGSNAQSIAEEHRRWNRQYAEPLKKFIQPHANNRNPDRRLRIGYVSPDFREHPVGQFLLPLLANHNKQNVEVFCYAHVPFPDSMTQRLQEFSDKWQSIVKLTDAQAADLIRQDKIDILVDLTMHTGQNRLLVFARKPAPVQVTYLAYCSSTGLEAIDYRLSDPYLDPENTDLTVYSEQTFYLPETYWCYQPSIETPEVNPLPASKTDFITFGCLNNFCKINEPTLATWSKLLRKVPNAQLLIHSHAGSHRQRVQDRLQRDGIDPKRVRFAAKVPTPNYFRQYHEIDIALDPFPFGGGTTTCDALWMGIPVVSLVGKTAVGRGGLSILTNVGLPELSGRSEDDYVRIASELAHDLTRLNDLRSTLRQLMQKSPLMNAPRFARNIESAYRKMWKHWCEKNLMPSPTTPVT